MPSQEELFLRYVGQTSDAPIMFEVATAEGIYLTSSSGQRNIDLISGIGPALLGHGHPYITKAIKRQVDNYTHTMVYGEYIQSPQVQLATQLQNFLPDVLNSVFMVNSGTEAVEGAMKLARKATGRYEIVALEEAYHGSTQGAAALMSDPIYTQAYRPLQGGIRFIERENKEILSHITAETAAVIVEPIKGEEGVYPLSIAYFQALQKRCNEVGALLIADEIQCGYGRTGKMWAFEYAGCIPDILITAKAFGGGMPLGAFIANRNLMQELSRKPILGHMTTFGGHPVSCAAAVAVLDILSDTDVINETIEKGEIYRKHLQHGAIMDVRGQGLMIAVELPDFGFTKEVIQLCMKNGVLSDWFLFNTHSMRIYPPLIIKEKEIMQSIDIILSSIEEVSKRGIA